MAVYTLSLNFLDNLEPKEQTYISNIMFCFVNTYNSAKIAVDKDKYILTKYKAVKKYREIIKTWIDLLANIPSSMENCNIDLSNIDNPDEMCLALCNATNGCRKLIVHSTSSFPIKINDEGCVVYNGNNIHIIDKDDAAKEINACNITINNLNNSIVAGGNVEHSKNKVK